MRVLKVGIAAGGKRTQQIECCRGLPIGLNLPARVGDTRLGGELGAVDDVAAVDRQFDRPALFHRRGARLGELAGDAADLHHRRRRRIGQHHRHLQKQPEEIANIVGAVFGEALRAIAALQQEGFAGGDLSQGLFQVARLAGKNQRRKTRKLRLNLAQRLGVGIVRHLQSRLGPPGIRTPFGGVGPHRHDTSPNSPFRARVLRREPIIHNQNRWLQIPAVADAARLE